MLEPLSRLLLSDRTTEPLLGASQTRLIAGARSPVQALFEAPPRFRGFAPVCVQLTECSEGRGAAGWAVEPVKVRAALLHRRPGRRGISPPSQILREAAERPRQG